MASKEFSKKLKELRLRAGFSQKQVYEHFNIPQSTFSSWEVGKSEPSGEMLLKLCEYYDCDMLKEFSETDNSGITYEELEIIRKHRDLDDHGREMVDFILEKEYERSKVLANQEKESANNIVEILSNLDANAAHARTDIDIPEDTDTSDNDIMNDEDF